jgi:hypothetical protein
MFVNKNWPNDLHVGCLKLTNFASICEVEFNLTKELNTEFVDVVECDFFSISMTLCEFVFKCVGV